MRKTGFTVLMLLLLICCMSHISKYAVAGKPVSVQAAATPVKLSKISTTLNITSSTEGKTYGSATIKVKAAKGVKIKSIVYKSNNSKIASVTSKGKVKAKKKGSTKITITVTYVKKNKKATKRLTYKVNIKNVTKAPSVSLSKSTLKLAIIQKGKNISYGSAKITVNHAKGVSITKTVYKSSASRIAVVASNGIVKAKAKGTAKIKAIVTYKKNKKTYKKNLICKVEVTKQNTSETDIGTGKEVVLLHTEGKNANDVKILRRIITEQQALEADVDEDLSSIQYAWDKSGRLTEIDWRDCDLSGKISFEGLDALEVLACAYNELSDLNVNKCSSLMTLFCRENMLSSLDISTNMMLCSLDCAENELSSLDVSTNKDLMDLDCSGNKIKNIDISKNADLTNLSCSDNLISRLDVSNNKLLTLNCDDDVVVIREKTNSTEEVNLLNTEGLNALDLGVLKKIITEQKAFGAEVDENMLSSQYVWSESGKLTEINWNDSGLYGEISFNGLDALTVLYINRNELSSLDVSENKSLKGLYCSENQLSNLDVSKLTALTELNCGSNQLSSIDVSNNTALTWLCCRENQLSSLDVSKNTALEELDCEDNQLSSLDVTKNKNLTDLCYDENVIVKK